MTSYASSPPIENGAPTGAPFSIGGDEASGRTPRNLPRKRSCGNNFIGNTTTQLAYYSTSAQGAEFKSNAFEF